MYGRVYPLYTRAGFILPFQLMVPHETTPNIGSFVLYNANTNAVVANLTTALQNTGLTTKQFASLGYDVIVYPGLLPAVNSMSNGRYYFAATINSITYYSEIFTVVNDIEPYLQISWWDASDFIMDAGTIVYTDPTFKNVLYLQADLAKPEYPFEEEGETRDGYFFPTKQISEKRYRFNFIASEYLLDVMRFIRMADYAQIVYHGNTYSLDSFLITPTWEGEGDVAVVEAEFDTATVAKKIQTMVSSSPGPGPGPEPPATEGDFNDDFNNDFLI